MSFFIPVFTELNNSHIRYVVEDPLVSIDLFIDNPIEFGELWLRAELVDIGGETIKIASIRDLIELKKLSNRPQDLEDINKLEDILRRKTNTNGD